MGSHSQSSIKIHVLRGGEQGDISSCFLSFKDKFLKRGKDEKGVLQ